MKRRDFLHQTAFLAGGAVAILRYSGSAARAQTPQRELRLVFARGSDLFAASDKDGNDARRVLTLSPADLWAVSPDGRRVVWVVRDEKSSGLTVFLSDLLGRHQKKLFATSDLRDRQGRKVERVGIDKSENPRDWGGLVSLGWSADGRTVYAGFTQAAPMEPTAGIGDGFKRATFAVDAVNGTALVDADGRWKRIASLTHIDAQGGLLVGVDAAVLGEQTGDAVPLGVVTLGGPIAIVNTTEGGTRTVLGSSKINASHLYDVANYPALAPDHRNIAYLGALDKGLWLRDRWAGAEVVPKKLADQAVGRPQWTDDGKTILFLAPASSGGVPTSNDLFQIDVNSKSGSTTAPRLVLRNVDSFTLAPL